MYLLLSSKIIALKKRKKYIQLNIFDEYEKTHKKIFLWEGQNHRYEESPDWIYCKKWGIYTLSYYYPKPPKITNNLKNKICQHG